MKVWDNVIIGAGFSGLILARRLQQEKYEVLVLDKSKSVGGRMATRRDGDAGFDHGAQHSSSAFLNYFASRPWTPWFQRGNKTQFAFKEGMNKAAKHLSQGIDLKLNHKVQAIHPSENYFRLEIENGESLFARRIYLTCPVPQSVELLKSSRIDYPLDLEKISYYKALVGLLRVSSSHPVFDEIKYKEPELYSIFSISNQRSKEVSQELAFTVVMNPEWSEKYFDQSEIEVLNLIEKSFASFLDHQFNLAEKDYQLIRSQLKKWRYSHPRNPLSVGHVSVGDGNIVVLGDGLSGGSLVQAAQSALSVPQKLFIRSH